MIRPYINPWLNQTMVCGLDGDANIAMPVGFTYPLAGTVPTRQIILFVLLSRSL